MTFKHKLMGGLMAAVMACSMQAKALDEITFSAERGKIIGILGPNGAGKTTLLKTIATLILPDSGHVAINGLHVGKADEKIRSFIGFVTSEERNFYWRLSGMQNLELYAQLYGLNKKSASVRINELLDLFSINYAHKRFDSYSTGMKRKCALVRALLHNPDILLLDEPTKSLDYNGTHELHDLIRLKTHEGITTLFATHDVEEAETLCDSFLVLHHGTVAAAGTLAELRTQTHSANASLSEVYLELTINV